jgi:hypothetical protein
LYPRLRQRHFPEAAVHDEKPAEKPRHVSLFKRPVRPARQRPGRPFFRFPAHRRDAEQRALRLAQQVSQTDRVVDVAADIRIQQNLLHFHPSFLYLPAQRL